MKAYKIDGKSQQGSMSVFPKDFIGMFVVSEEAHILKGYVEESIGGKKSQSFLLGFFEETKLAFYKMSNEIQTLPLMYLFQDYQEIGKWGALELFVGTPYVLGKAKVSISEIGNEVMAERQVREVYSKMQGGCGNFNISAERYLYNLKIWLSQLG